MSSDLRIFKYVVFMEHQEVPGRLGSVSKEKKYSGHKFVSHQHTDGKQVKSHVNR